MNRNPDYSKIKKHTWKKGQSGNPKGKPLGTISISAALRKILDMETTVDNPLTGTKAERMKVSERVALSMIAKAIKGSERAAEIIGERTEGKVAQPIRHSGSIAGPANPVQVDLSKISEPALQRMLANLEKKHGRAKPKED